MPATRITESQYPRSALRYRPTGNIDIDTLADLPHPTRSGKLSKSAPLAITTTVESEEVSDRGFSWALPLAFLMVALVLIITLFQAMLSWGTTVSDDMHYGRPRTTHVDYFVGQERGSAPTHFTAINTHGQIYVLEIPGGDTTKSKLLVGPHILGTDADLAPVTLQFPGNPRHPDLLLKVQGVQMLFHNRNGAFVP